MAASIERKIVNYLDATFYFLLVESLLFWLWHPSFASGFYVGLVLGLYISRMVMLYLRDHPAPDLKGPP